MPLLGVPVVGTATFVQGSTDGGSAGDMTAVCFQLESNGGSVGTTDRLAVGPGR